MAEANPQTPKESVPNSESKSVGGKLDVSPQARQKEASVTAAQTVAEPQANDQPSSTAQEAKQQKQQKQQKTVDKKKTRKHSSPATGSSSSDSKTEPGSSRKVTGKKAKSKKPKFQLKPMQIAVAGIVAALYVVLCLPFASISFGIVQFRLAEVMTVMPAFSAMAIPGVFLGCLLANILNPDNLGLIDILGGSLATLIAALTTYWLAKPYRRILLAERQPGYSKLEANTWKKRFMRFVMLFPPIFFNAIIVGSYLPYLLLGHDPTALEIIGSIASIFLSQSLVIYILGMSLVIALEKAKFPVESN